MGNIITIGLLTEGRTDIRFLEGIIRKTFNDVALECNSEIEVYESETITVRSHSFEEQVFQAARKAFTIGSLVLCIHTDADSPNDQAAYTNKIIPAFTRVHSSTGELCRNLVPIVPVQMIESWMLADTELLKDEIGTNKTDQQLGIHLRPETYSDPKKIIEDAIRIASQELTRRQRNRQITIAELYQPIGQKLNSSSLLALPSYSKFKEKVRNSFRQLNYLN